MENNFQPQLNTPQPALPSIWATNPKLKKLLVALIFTFLFSGIGLVIYPQWDIMSRAEISVTLPKHKAPPKPASTTTNPNPIDTSTWKTYRNEEYGFEFEYPSNKYSQPEDNGKGYIRIQNYDPSVDMLRLSSGEFYLEISVGQALNNKLNQCSDDFSTYKVVTIGNVTFYEGPGTDGGDQGGSRQLLCTVKNNNMVSIAVTEFANDGKITNPIFNSLKFTK